MSQDKNNNPLSPAIAILFLGGIGMVIFVRFISWMNAGIGSSSILEALK